MLAGTLLAFTVLFRGSGIPALTIRPSSQRRRADLNTSPAALVINHSSQLQQTVNHSPGSEAAVELRPRQSGLKLRAQRSVQGDRGGTLLTLQALQLKCDVAMAMAQSLGWFEK